MTNAAAYMLKAGVTAGAMHARIVFAAALKRAAKTGREACGQEALI